MSYVNMISRTVETPLGPMTAHFNSGTCVVFNQDQDQFFTVNRVEYNACFTARLIDGAWQIEKYNTGRSTLSINRHNSVKMFDYSRSAFDKAEKALADWLPGWAAEQEVILADAEARDCEEKLARLKSKLADARDLVANLTLAVAEADERVSVAFHRLDCLRAMALESI